MNFGHISNNSILGISSDGELKYLGNFLEARDTVYHSVEKTKVNFSFWLNNSTLNNYRFFS